METLSQSTLSGPAPLGLATLHSCNHRKVNSVGRSVMHRSRCGMEVWKDAVGFEGFYEVSNLGFVRRVGIRTGATLSSDNILRPRINRHGRPQLTLCRDGTKCCWTLQKVVCLAFHGPKPTPKHGVAHYDGNKLNNKADNLRWATATENAADKVRHGTVACGLRNGHYTKPERTARGERHGMSILRENDVRMIRSLWSMGVPTRVLGVAFGVSNTNVKDITRGKIWRSVK